MKISRILLGMFMAVISEVGAMVGAMAASSMAATGNMRSGHGSYSGRTYEDSEEENDEYLYEEKTYTNILALDVEKKDLFCMFLPDDSQNFEKYYNKFADASIDKVSLKEVLFMVKTGSRKMSIHPRYRLVLGGYGIDLSRLQPQLSNTGGVPITEIRETYKKDTQKIAKIVSEIMKAWIAKSRDTVPLKELNQTLKEKFGNLLKNEEYKDYVKKVLAHHTIVLRLMAKTILQQVYGKTIQIGLQMIQIR
jgi:hypothetical protein